MPDEAIVCGERPIEVWPEGQRVSGRGADRTIVGTQFADFEAYHPRLIATILELENDPEFATEQGRAVGGQKVYHLEKWGSPEADLVNARAVALFRHAQRCDEAVVDMSWANVYRAGDYSMPHSHPRATASVVYCLDPGDDDRADEWSGQLCFVDPRYSACCQVEKGYMTNPITPRLGAGGMVIFPSKLVHCVNPYRGERPRITLAWNINTSAVSGSPLNVLD